MKDFLILHAIQLQQVAHAGILPMDGGLQSDNLAVKLLTTVVGWCAPIGALVLVVFIVKDIVGIAKGDGSASIGKVIIKIIIALLLLGVMVAMLNYSSFATFMGSFFTNTVNQNNLPTIN